MLTKNEPVHRILITGGAGFVGSAVAASLTQSGYKVAVYDNFKYGTEANLTDANSANLEIINGDILNPKQLAAAVDGFAPTQVMHLAALHYIPYCEEHRSETLEVNVVGTQKISSRQPQTETASFCSPRRRPYMQQLMMAQWPKQV